MSETVVEQIRGDLFRAEIPLPRNPLKATNSYIIKDEKRHLTTLCIKLSSYSQLRM